MAEAVKPDRRAARRADTEARLIAAATELFLARGYTATTLAAVAERAGLAARTLYTRFAGKAELLRRCVEVAIAGDSDATALDERPWMTDAMGAATLDERLRRMAAVTAMLMDRTAPLLAVAQQAAASEPGIAEAAQAGREDTRRTLLAFWHGIADDGLLAAGADVEWLAETGALLAHADTYLLLGRTTRWDVDTYARWLHTTWSRLAQASAS
jgi:AcrR family transcriptional regulator